MNLKKLQTKEEDCLINKKTFVLYCMKKITKLKVAFQKQHSQRFIRAMNRIGQNESLPFFYTVPSMHL